jgi:hypothetical protein
MIRFMDRFLRGIDTGYKNLQFAFYGCKLVAERKFAMKKIVFFLLLLPCISGLTQNAGIDGVANLTQLYDSAGRSLLGKKSIKTIGSPMLNDNWGTGEVKFVNGRVLKNASLRYNLVTGKLHYKVEDLEITFLDPVAEFSYHYINEEGNESKVVFRNGYPGSEPGAGLVYFQVLAESKRFQLLKSIHKKLDDHYEYNGPVSRIYLLSSELYLYDREAESLVNIKNKQSLIHSIPQLEEEVIRKYGNSNNKFRSEQELIDLIARLKN